MSQHIYSGDLKSMTTDPLPEQTVESRVLPPTSKHLRETPIAGMSTHWGV